MDLSILKLTINYTPNLSSPETPHLGFTLQGSEKHSLTSLRNIQSHSQLEGQFSLFRMAYFTWRKSTWFSKVVVMI